MPYPRPDERTLHEWQTIGRLLRDQSGADQMLLRVAYPTSLDILIASPEGALPYAAGERAHRDGSHLCEAVLEKGDLLQIPDIAAEARWDASPERRAGIGAYLGALLKWPDGELFGTFAILFREAISEERCASLLPLLQTLATTVELRLALLYREEQAHYDATHDALTGLANETLFNELADYQIKHARRSGVELWMLAWEIDDYAQLQTSLGIEASDDLLRAATERAKSCIRQSDVIARIGDNLFTALVGAANEFVASAVADRIQRNTRRLKARTEDRSGITLSVGTSPWTSGEPMDVWRARTLEAMHQARQGGGDQT
ncbi:MAG: diguanylate cyclase (GGDEF)-like protein, partial [Halieaceae bacterium]